MYLTATSFTQLAGVRHGFFTRNGGVSSGIFAQLNCGGRDSAESAAVVDENRRRVAETIGIQPECLLSTAQIHSPIVVTVEKPWSFSARPEADAMVSRVPGIGLGVLTADCAPVLFVDPKNRIIGAAHSGWKGAFGGIAQATVDAMERLGAERSEIIASVGPALAQASYQIDDVFYRRFLEADAQNKQFFTPLDATGHGQFDLPGYVHKRLRDVGIRSIEMLLRDTYAEEADFYSFRRSVHRRESDYGRQISVISLEDTSRGYLAC